MSNLAVNMDAPASVDYVLPSERKISLSGNMARRLLDNELDTGVLRPFLSNDGRRSYYTRNEFGDDGAMKQRAILTNDDTNATLRFLDWKLIDEAVVKAAKPRMRAAADLQAGGLVYSLPNGIAKTVMQFQQQSDISGAVISMDGLRQSESDRPVFSTVNFPIPIIHKDFQFSLREVLASRTGYSPLDLTTVELAARRVAEQVEQLTLGTAAVTTGAASGQLLGQSSYTWGGGSIYGYMNFPQRITYTITLPTAGGWTPATTVDDVMMMKKLSQQAFHRGPWILYCGLDWDPYMDDDYKPTYNDTTLRQRLRGIDGLLDVRTVDYLPGYALLLVQQTTDVVRMVIGMQITTIQWESHGGMQLNFKVMCVMLPQIRTDFYQNTGIVHGS